jgi:glycosyltransferase involved in cell wall biosynthesis
MRVLILAYDFPPYVSVGGLRPYSWYRYLKEFGVEPVVVTRQWANHYGDERDYIAPSATDRVEVERTEFGTLVRAPHRPNVSQRLLLRDGPQRHRLVRKSITALLEVGQYYADIGPRAPLIRAARAYLGDHPVDALVATGGPFVLFRYASALSREFGIPWVADYRDPWSQDERSIPAAFARSWITRLEERHTASASRITTAAEVFQVLLAKLHGGERVVVLPNGYDPEAMEAAQGVPQSGDRFTVAFAGSVYPWHPVESVFREMEEFAVAHPEPPFALHLVGVGGRESLETLLRERFPALAVRTTFTRRLPNAEMAVEMSRANALLLFNDYANPGTKIYDYLALRRRVLLCYTGDREARRLSEECYNIRPPSGAEIRAQEVILSATGAGVAVRDPGHLRMVLEDMRREFVATGAISCASHDVEGHSRRTHAGALADLLRSLPR